MGSNAHATISEGTIIMQNYAIIKIVYGMKALTCSSILSTARDLGGINDNLRGHCKSYVGMNDNLINIYNIGIS